MDDGSRERLDYGGGEEGGIGDVALVLPERAKWGVAEGGVLVGEVLDLGEGGTVGEVEGFLD